MHHTLTSPLAHIGQGQGSGKLILFGEHAVVWGAPAIAASIGLGATASAKHGESSVSCVTVYQDDSLLFSCAVDDSSAVARSLQAILDALNAAEPLELEVRLHVPAGAGLGSSAAMAVAIARAVFAWRGEQEDERLQEAVAASEGVFHTRASGVDQAAALSTGIFRFLKGPPLQRTPLEHEPFKLAICQPEAGASTARMVEGVAQRRERQPRAFAHIGALIEHLVDEAQVALERGDWRSLGELMNLNHGLLVGMGVSTTLLDDACHLARAHGALGAKLTGAGGGGCLIALAPDDATHEAILSAWRARGWRTQTSTHGAR